MYRVKIAVTTLQNQYEHVVQSLQRLMQEARKPTSQRRTIFFSARADVQDLLDKDRLFQAQLAHALSIINVSITRAKETGEPLLTTDDIDKIADVTLILINHVERLQSEEQQTKYTAREALKKKATQTARKAAVWTGIIGALGSILGMKNVQRDEAAAAPAAVTASAPAVATSTPLYATIPTTPVTAARETMQGIATFYGTERDGFGYVSVADPIVAKLLRENGHDPATLPAKVIARKYLEPNQMLDLFKINQRKYPLIRRDGQPFDPREAVVAMDKRYLGKEVRITNPRTGKSVVARVGDTGAFSDPRWAQARGAHTRMIDLSKGTSDALGHNGKETVEVTLLE